MEKNRDGVDNGVDTSSQKPIVPNLPTLPKEQFTSTDEKTNKADDHSTSSNDNPRPSTNPHTDTPHPNTTPQENTKKQENKQAGTGTGTGTGKKSAGIQASPKLVNYADVSAELDETYLHDHINNSNILDIIGIYVKGQKILYTEAKTVCELRLSYLMLPSIFFTVSCSIINLLIVAEYGRPISSILNGAVAFILAVINYLKLDARAEAHRVSAYKYDRLLSYIEFQSGKQLFLTEANGKINEIIEKIEGEIKEIKETNPFVLPEIIRYGFPHLTSVNVFTEVKLIDNQEMIYKNTLTGVVRKIAEQNHLLVGAKDVTATTIKLDIEKLERQRENLVKTIIELQKKYVSIDKTFNVEINQYFGRNKWGLKLCDWLKV